MATTGQGGGELLRATTEALLGTLLIKGAAMTWILGCVLRAAQAKKTGQRRRASGRSIGDRRGRDTRRFGPKARGRERRSGPEGHSTGNEPSGHRGRKLLFVFEISKRRNRTERRRQGAQAAKHTARSVRGCRERKRERKIENITDNWLRLAYGKRATEFGGR